MDTANTGLLQNKLFLQYLAAAGQDISSGNAIGTNVNAVTQQNISAQNYNKLVQHFLKGGVPGGKFSADDSGHKFHFPPAEKPRLDVPADFTLGTKPTIPTMNQTGGGLDKLNPFRSSQQSEISPSDLAGLTPGNIASAANIGLSEKNAAVQAMLSGQNLDVDRIAKIAQINESIARTKNLRNPTEKLPNSVREYNFYIANGGKESYPIFKAGKTTLQLEYNDAVASGYKGDIMQYQIELNKAKGTNINISPAEKVLRKAKVKGEAYYSTPDWAVDVNKYVDSDAGQMKIMNSKFPENEATFNLTVEEVERGVIASGGKIIGTPTVEGGRVVVWKVKWPSGNTKEIRYDFGQPK